ncbi:MAG: FKBP-type peptidyl-prolyl cis-trans isomerase, partial [Dehalococcoidia bacterium]|nr:FKBP-type peptidyl-prolyl cis-trans isomerase [Dehalococcoidia bacterium]
MDQDEDKGELIIEDLVVGQGVEAKEGNVITVNYTGWLENGTQFDSSLSSVRDPLVMTLGAGQVIQGWDEGIPGMKVGGKR